ncbi:hypothetical protein KC722_01250 [Candidatus Kaiserbacteria bacterium]|nr:hypothetical protein [Candidatus Kaiserbacteria bacterium]MCB9811805.1 hypothetical protein [Candidatus Nomurabacteria bacterium]
MISAVLAVSGVATSVDTQVAYGQITTQVDEKSEIASATAGNTELAVREYFSDIPVMIEVARCESTFRHQLADGSILQGKVDPADTGVMQINKRFHEAAAAKMGLNLDDLYDNMAYARHLYEKQGTQPWSASSPCWGRTLAYNN